MKKNILVTGGLGYIGSHTVVELIENGYNIVIIDNLSNSSMSVLNGIEKIFHNISNVDSGVSFYNMDCRNTERLENLMVQEKIDAVMHFAAYKSVNESVEHPLKYYDNNINSLISVLECMRRVGIKDIIFSSSCTVYGNPDMLPVTESSPIKSAQSPYGHTKQICEEILRSSTAFLKPTILRYFNPIGAHPSALIGENPNGIPANLMPYITQTAVGKRELLSIYGDDYNTPDGTCIRDYIYVVDLAKAHVKALEYSFNNDYLTEVFNIGTGNGLSVKYLVDKFIEVTGVDLPYKIVGRREGDIAKIYADPSRANELLDWKADTPIEDVLRSAYAWELVNK